MAAGADEVTHPARHISHRQRRIQVQKGSDDQQLPDDPDRTTGRRDHHAQPTEGAECAQQQVMVEVTTEAAEFDPTPTSARSSSPARRKPLPPAATSRKCRGCVPLRRSTTTSSPRGQLAAVRTPTVAAVGGYALGGGCELAMMCDVLIAADNAKFGQPEIKLGGLPGMGGSQRLTRAVGKAKAMDLILTGRNMDAAEAERCGLVSLVVPAADLLTEAKAVATTISEMSLVGGEDDQGSRQPRLRDHAGRRIALRASGMPFGVRHRRPVRRHDSVLQKRLPSSPTANRPP